MEFKDYYQTLGVPRTATEAEIKKAFRKLARQNHPDVAEDKAAAEEKFKEINEAYEVLGDPEKREKYDALGMDWQQGGARSYSTGRSGYADPEEGRGYYQEFRFNGTGFSDFFEQFFGGGARGYHGFPGQDSAPGHGGQRAGRGQDIEGDLMVTLEEALNGTERELSLQLADPATGKTETHTFTVRIPAGASEGRRIRVPGKGGSGFRGGEPGDLFLRVRFAAHPDFRCKGSDLHHDLELHPWDAVLGTELVVPTLGGGKVKLKIPPGTQNGQQLRLKGRGLPQGRSGDTGDLYVHVLIQTPTHITAEQRELWEKLAATAQ